MKNGMITKLIHKGQKVYGVITGFDDTNVTVRFPICGVSGQVEIAEQTLPAADCRKPMLRQDKRNWLRLSGSLPGCHCKKRFSRRMGQV